MVSALPTVVVRRSYPASKQWLFDAFTRPELMVRWLSPADGIRIDVQHQDLRVGGNYRFHYTEPNGDENTVEGEYRDVSPPDRLVFTWAWLRANPDAGVDTLVTVEFAEEDADNTQITLTHQKFSNQPMADRHNAGWSGAMDRLGRLALSPK